MCKFEDIFNQVEQLLRGGDSGRAIRLLTDERREAKAQGRVNDAAALSNVLGSALSFANQDMEALEAYAWAEKEKPQDEGLKLSTARHLLTVLGRPQEGRDKALDVVQSGTALPAERHSAFALVGAASLALTDREGARAAFLELCNPALLDKIGASGCDLNLAELVADDERLREPLTTYLAGVAEKAKVEGNLTVHQRARELLTHVSGA